MKRLFSLLILLATGVILYRKAIRLWWLYDDVWLLHVTLARRWTMPFTEGDTWHRTFTPLLDSSYEVLLAAAGLEVRWWHVAGISLIIACASAIFFALHLYVKAFPAFAGAFLFLVGVPLCAFATQLTLLNCVEALLLATISTSLFVVASRRQSNALVILSALLYIGAVLAAPMMVPLPLLLLALPERTWAVRARHLLVHGVAFILYLIWRQAVLGSLLGGPGWVIDAGEIPSILAAAPWKILLTWLGSGLEIGLLAIALIAIGMARSLSDRSTLVFASFALVLSLIPILLAPKDIGPRLTTTPWIMLCVLFAVGISKMKAGTSHALFLAAALALVVANRQEWGKEYAKSERMSDEALAFMSLDGASVLRAPSIPPAAMVELQWLKEEHYRRPRGSGWFYDDLYLCSSTLAGRRIYEYHPERRDVVEVTARIPDLARAYCASIRTDVPLQAEFRHRSGKLFWRFGPYPNGRWRVVLGGGLQAYDVPREDGFSLPGVPGLALRVRYQSPEGWVTYSPELQLEFAKQPDTIWKR